LTSFVNESYPKKCRFSSLFDLFEKLVSIGFKN
jgi:hypothetical protein